MDNVTYLQYKLICKIHSATNDQVPRKRAKFNVYTVKTPDTASTPPHAE